MLCGYHGLTRFPPPVVLYFDRTRKREGDSDKAYRRIALPPRARAKQFMRGTYLSLAGEVADPYQEWEQWDTNGAIVHVSPGGAGEADFEGTHAAAVVVLFQPSISAADQIQLAAASDALLARAGVKMVAVNCQLHDETCVDTFKPYSFPAVYYKHGQDEWKGYRGHIKADDIVAWAGVQAAAAAPAAATGAGARGEPDDAQQQREL
jgi:hypothetical protein